MTKKEAEAEFKQIYPDIHKSNDIPMRNQEWAFYTDRLCKDGIITYRQYMTWAYPRNWKQYKNK
jgi:hypothetical protein